MKLYSCNFSFHSNKYRKDAIEREVSDVEERDLTYWYTKAKLEICDACRCIGTI
jgi:hypothetical protein